LTKVRRGRRAAERTLFPRSLIAQRSPGGGKEDTLALRNRRKKRRKSKRTDGASGVAHTGRSSTPSQEAEHDHDSERVCGGEKGRRCRQNGSVTRPEEGKEECKLTGKAARKCEEAVEPRRDDVEPLATVHCARRWAKVSNRCEREGKKGRRNALSERGERMRGPTPKPMTKTQITKFLYRGGRGRGRVSGKGGASRGG
jgi:hypothetical protein